MPDKKNKKQQDKLDILIRKVDDLDARLTQHIDFIEKVYRPLQGSLDKLKGFFK